MERSVTESRLCPPNFLFLAFCSALMRLGQEGLLGAGKKIRGPWLVSVQVFKCGLLQGKMHWFPGSSEFLAD